MRQPLEHHLSAYEPDESLLTPGLREAGVLILIYEHENEQHIVFQKRTDSVRDHKGQVSFPGGGRDPGDLDLRHTALRETHEEIGVEPRDIDVIGRVDDLVTISNFRVRPYVGWLNRYPYAWKFSPFEVAYLLEVPVRHLLDPANYVPDRRRINGGWHEMPAYQWGDDLIWGATARMLTNFLDIWRAASAQGAMH